jgi:hypothetical protein
MNEIKKEEKKENEDDVLIPKKENEKEISLPNKEKEITCSDFFKNSPLILLILKIFLFSEGKLMRIFAQIGDLYFCILVTNFYVEIVIILLCAV